MQKDEKGLTATFYDKRVLDAKATKDDKTGEEHYTNKTYLQIKIQGDDKTVWDQPIRPTDPKRFPNAFRLYEEGGREIEGTRISALPGLSTDAATRYHMKGVRTIEDLAAADDFVLTNLGAGSREHKASANMYLENMAMKADAPKRGRPRKDVEAA